MNNVHEVYVGEREVNMEKLDLHTVEVLWTPPVRVKLLMNKKDIVGGRVQAAIKNCFWFDGAWHLSKSKLSKNKMERGTSHGPTSRIQSQWFGAVT